MTFWDVLGLVGIAIVFIFIFSKVSGVKRGAASGRNPDGDTSWRTFGNSGCHNGAGGGDGHGGNGGGGD
ncbi:MAG: hypothetical protein H7X92_09205 [Chitinophagales bacterium]|nr:hypothetical protein [Hyphomicrobiales bacterium]